MENMITRMDDCNLIDSITGLVKYASSDVERGIRAVTQFPVPNMGTSNNFKTLGALSSTAWLTIACATHSDSFFPTQTELDGGTPYV